MGTVAAQRAICKLLIENGKFDLSISATNPEIFKAYHPECKTVDVYEPLHANLGGKITRNHLQWVCFSIWNLIMLTFTCMLIPVGIIIQKRGLINRMKNCDVFLDQNLELFKGTPISLSLSLIKQKSRTLVFHKIFWSFRMFYTVWTIFVLKGAFKKRVVIGPASFGPFYGLPLLTKWMVKHSLNRYVDVILVRDPYSAQFLRELKVKNCITVTDAALLIKNTSKGAKKNSKLFIGFVPAFLTQTLTSEEVDNYALSHAQVIDQLINDSIASRIVILPSSNADVIICKKIWSLAENKEQITIIDTDDLTEYESWIEQLDLLITSRIASFNHCIEAFYSFFSNYL